METLVVHRASEASESRSIQEGALACCRCYIQDPVGTQVVLFQDVVTGITAQQGCKTRGPAAGPHTEQR
jgi:hypothetical protein